MALASGAYTAMLHRPISKRGALQPAIPHPTICCRVAAIGDDWVALDRPLPFPGQHPAHSLHSPALPACGLTRIGGLLLASL